MRFVILILVLTTQIAIAQDRLWLTAGVGSKFGESKLSWNTSINSRFYANQRWDKVFPELSFKYAFNDYFKPSLDYRFILNQSKNGKNRSTSNRININLNTGYKINRLALKLRLRGQFGMNGIMPDTPYEPDFDNALRIKPGLNYNIKGSKINPLIEAEWFYNLNNGMYGKQFTKFRFSAGVNWKINGSNELGLKYRYDYEFNIPKPDRYHILSLDYQFELNKVKKARI